MKENSRERGHDHVGITQYPTSLTGSHMGYTQAADICPQGSYPSNIGKKQNACGIIKVQDW